MHGGRLEGVIGVRGADPPDWRARPEPPHLDARHRPSDGQARNHRDSVVLVNASATSPACSASRPFAEIPSGHLVGRQERLEMQFLQGDVGGGGE